MVNFSDLTRYKRFFPVIKYTIVLAIVVWVCWVLYKSWDQLSQHEWKFNVGWLVCAGFFYILAFFPASLFWHLVLRKMGQKPNLFASLRAYYISQLGKYTPGKAMVVVMRAEIIRSENVRASFAAAAVFFETFAMMSVGAIIAVVIMLFCFHDHPQLHKYLLLNFVMLAFSVLPTIPSVFRFVAKKLGVGKGDPELDEKLNRLNFKTVLFGWCLMSLCWVFFGLSLCSSINGISLEVGPITGFPKYVAISAMSVVLGFVLMTPGGLGAREWVLITFLSPLILANITGTGETEGVSQADLILKAEGLAVAVAGVQRVVSIIAELVVGAALAGFGEKKV